MKTILDQIIATKQQEVALLKQTSSIKSFSNQPLFSQPVRSLKQSLLANEFGIIAEIKRKSPSGGAIFLDLDPIEVARSYEREGAAAISVLTDFNFFGGSTTDLELVRQHSSLPLLRKEFIIDELQLFEAKAKGADAVLLIAAILTKQQAHHFTIVARNLGMEVVFEIHTLHELDKINDEVDLIAVNNRNLAAQETSLEICINLAPYLPTFSPAIAASGMRSGTDLKRVQDAGYCGALIGEGILRTRNLSELTAINLQRP